MSKKDNHNISDDYEKSLNKVKKDKVETGILVDSTKVSIRNNPIPEYFARYKKRIFIFVIALIFIAGAAGSLYFAYSVSDKEYKEKTARQKEIAAENAEATKQYKSEYDDLKTKLETATGDDRIDQLAYITIVAKWINKNEDALKYALELESIAGTSMSAASVAEIYAAINDYPSAISYYDKAISRTDKISDPSGNSDYDIYVAKKNALEGRKQ